MVHCTISRLYFVQFLPVNQNNIFRQHFAPENLKIKHNVINNYIYFFIHALLTETSTEKNDVGNDFLENKNISFVFFMKSEWFV